MDSFPGFRLNSCKKFYSFDQDKTVSPADTVKETVSKLKKMYDLSHFRLEPRKDAIDGAFSFSCLSDQLTTSGKGLTEDQAKASAVMEFAERYSWLHFDFAKYHGYTFCSYNELIKGGTPTVNEGYFFDNFIDLTGSKGLTAEIKQLPLRWIKAISLNDYKEFYSPINWHNYVYISNGLASGNAMEEAILQGLCEVIERENIARLLRDKRVANDIDQDSIPNPLIKNVLKAAKANGIKFIIKDISYDFKVPTIIVFGIQISSKGKLVYKGAGQGTHPNPEKAIIRALSEYFESYSLLLTVQNEVVIDWEKALRYFPKRHYGFLVLLNQEMLEKSNRKVKVTELKDFSRTDIKDEIELIAKTLKKSGYNSYFIDKTNQALKIPACRIFVPGFRNVMVSDIYEPWLALSESFYEAGQKEASAKYLRKAYLRASFNSDTFPTKVNPELCFKDNYRDTLFYFSGFKKNIYDTLKAKAPILKKQLENEA